MATPPTIIGAGASGRAWAAHLWRQTGKQQFLYAHPHHHAAADLIKEKGYLEAFGEISGVSHPIVSTDMQEAIQFSKIIIITVPAFAHEDILKELEKFDLSDHTIASIGGSFFTLAAYNRVKPKCFLETGWSPYSVRMDQAEVRVRGIKRVLQIGSLPIDVSPEYRSEIDAIFPVPLEWGNALGKRYSVLEMGMWCIGGVLHPITVLMNATRETPYFLYREGMSPHVINAITRLDEARVKEIGKAWGFDLLSFPEMDKRAYPPGFPGLKEFAREAKAHNTTKAGPYDLQSHRMIVEDIGYMLVPLYELGLKAGVDSSPVKTVINLAAMLTGCDYMKTGRTLKKLGLDNVEKEKILAIFG